MQIADVVTFGRSLKDVGIPANAIDLRRTMRKSLNHGGDIVDLLGEEMKNLKRRCRKILWLNPLLGSENYEPLCKGMQAVLPYLDYFLPAHNLESLMALGRTPLLS